MADSLEQLRSALADRYDVTGEIGSGGMATVFLARDLKHDREVALKVFRPEIAALIGTERFFREIRIAAKLNHPHILPLHDSGQADGLLYYVMPYVQGESLRDRLEARRRLPVEDALTIARQVAAALDYAHRQGIVHRDIKPGNILLHEGEALVTDFGIALAIRAAAGDRLTQTGLFIGTPAYMSPEQATGDPRLDGRSDIYSLGCVVHEMLCGDPPFTGPNTQAIIAQLLTERPPDVRSCREGVSAHVAAAVRTALARDPAQRFAAAADFAAALTRPQRGVSRVPGLRALAMAGAGVFALAAATLLVRQITQRPSSAPLAGERVHLVVSSEGIAQDPALSPDGKLLAYVATGDVSGNIDLFVRLVGGGQPVQLTNDAAVEGFPAFSRNGERIAFTRRDSAQSASAVWTVPALGGDAAPVMHNAGLPAWSPDGDELAVVLGAGEPSERIARVGLDGRVRSVVFQDESPYIGIRRLSWSPDGATLAVGRSRGGAASELWIVPAKGGAARRLLDEPASVVSRDPTFTADGRALVYSSSRSGATNLWRVELSGGDPIQITSGAGPDAWPTVASDGAIAYQNSRWRNSLFAYDVRADSQRTLLTHSPYLWAPAIAPDGKEVAFSRGDVDGSWSVWITSFQGGPARRLTSGAEPTIYPRFSPDGRWVIYFSWSSAPGRIWRVPRTGGPPEALTPAGQDASYGDVSPDGRWLAFARVEAGVSRIYISALAVGGAGGEGAARRVGSEPATLPRWSPDGQSLAFARDRQYQGGIFVLAADGSRERRLTERGGWPVWTGPSRVGYLVVGAGGAQEAYSISVTTGETKRIPLRYTASNAPFDMSRDGTTIVTTDATHLADEIWLLRRSP